MDSPVETFISPSAYPTHIRPSTNPMLQTSFCMSLRCFLISFFLGIRFLAAEPPPPIQINAEIGWANSFKNELPVPLQIDMTSQGTLIEGNILVSYQDSQGNQRRHSSIKVPFSLPAGSKKRWNLTLPGIDGNSVRIHVIRKDGTPLSQQEFFGLPVEKRQSLWVTIQDPREDERWSPPRGDSWRNASIPPSSLPENFFAYSSMDVIFWRSRNASCLGEKQREALSLWVKHGGTLILAGGRTIPFPLMNTHIPSPWGDTIPFPVSNFNNLPLAPTPFCTNSISHSLSSTAPLPPNATIGIRPLSGKSGLTRMALGDTRFCVETPCGKGRLIQLAFDPQDLFLQNLEWPRDFWDALVGSPPSRDLAITSGLKFIHDLFHDESHQELARILDYRVVSITYILTLFLVFAGLAFGLNFWMFRKSRRYEWAWLILAGSSILLFWYNKSMGRVGGFAPVRQAERTCSLGVLGENSLLSFTHSGILSPRSRQTIWRGPNPSQILFNPSSMNPMIWNGNQPAHPSPLDPGAFTVCESICIDTLPGKGLSLHVSKVPNGIMVEIKNETGLELQNIQADPDLHPTILSKQYSIFIPTKLLKEAPPLGEISFSFELPGQKPLIPSDVDRYVCIKQVTLSLPYSHLMHLISSEPQGENP